LTQHGVDEDDAHASPKASAAAARLVTARVPEPDRGRIEAITIAVDIAQRSEVWQKSGWDRFDPTAPPYTADEIRGERELYCARV
jgi:hypothetical protein